MLIAPLWSTVTKRECENRRLLLLTPPEPSIRATIIKRSINSQEYVFRLLDILGIFLFFPKILAVIISTRANFDELQFFSFTYVYNICICMYLVTHIYFFSPAKTFGALPRYLGFASRQCFYICTSSRQPMVLRNVPWTRDVSLQMQTAFAVTCDRCSSLQDGLYIKRTR